MRLHQDLSREFTVWCCACNAWQQESASSVRAFTSIIRANGWRLRVRRWFCPTCASGTPHAEPRE